MAGWGYRTLRLPMVVATSVVAFLVAVTAAVAGEPGTTPGASSLGDGGVRVLQMNLCDSGLARCYTGRSVAEAGGVIRAEAPDVVTLNEVCQDDLAPLERALTDGGGGAAVAAFQPAWDRGTGAALRCRNGRPYGVALVLRSAGTAYEAVGGAYPMQDAGSAELRAWLCLGPRTARPADAASLTVCTTHLASGSPAVAHAQCAYLTGTVIPAVRARARSAPVVLGGDLNLRADGAHAGTCLPSGDRRADDGQVQHVVATPGLVPGPPRTIAMPATDHPGLLVTLTRDPSGDQ
jgi:endonuclease/exonuclease/phosphatase family metal-dependent hydrolase